MLNAFWLGNSSVKRFGASASPGQKRSCEERWPPQVAATQTAWQQGCSGALAGGTHHAFYAEGAGYCVFNDIAISILWLREANLAQRAAVIDLDVHQGDGTAAIFEDDPEVYTLSLHGAHNFPFRVAAGMFHCAMAQGMPSTSSFSPPNSRPWLSSGRK